MLRIHPAGGTAPAPKVSALSSAGAEGRRPRGRSSPQQPHRNQTCVSWCPRLLFLLEPASKRPSAGPAETPTWCSFPWALPLEPICALLTTSRHTARTNTSPLVQSASSHPPTLFCAMPKTISTCTSSPHLQSCWPDGQVCLSGRAGSQEQLARSYKLLGSPQIWLHCSTDLSLMHHPAADPASPCLLERARKPRENIAVWHSLQKVTGEELLEEEEVRAPGRSQSRAWSWSAL